MPSKITISKWNGDDVYSWAVFVNGRLAHPSLTGLNRAQARYHRDVFKDQLKGNKPSGSVRTH